MSDPVITLMTRLQTRERLRVWSLVITVFGDSVSPRGGRIAAARLGRIFDRMGIEPGTLRTALSRLSSDGWISREREGRNAFYRLSDPGAAEFGPAAALIYAPPLDGPVQEWRLALGDAGNAIPGVPLAGHGFLWPAQIAPAPGGVFSMIGRIELLPDMLRAGTVSDEQTRAVIALREDFEPIAAAELDGLTAVALRTLLIHQWRRIALRWADVPAELAPRGWPGIGIRAFVAGLYHALSPAADMWLQEPCSGVATGMPALPDGFRRF